MEDDQTDVAHAQDNEEEFEDAVPLEDAGAMAWLGVLGMAIRTSTEGGRHGLLALSLHRWLAVGAGWLSGGLSLSVLEGKGGGWDDDVGADE